MRSSRPAGISSRGIRHHPISSRLSIGSECQTSAMVTTWSRPVCATRSTSASGAASRAASTPPGRGARTLIISSARSAIRCSPSLLSRLIERSRRRGVKLPPSGKITNASFSSRLRASSPDLRLEVATLARARRDEPARQPGEQHAERRVPGEHLLEHHPGLAAVPVHQRVHQDERVARTRMAAEHQQRLAGIGVRRRADGLDLQAQHPPGLAEEHDQVALHEVVVDPLEERVADEHPEARGDPEPEELDQDEALQGQVHHAQPEQAQRTQPSRDERREHVAGQQPQRQRRPEQHGHDDEQRRDHDPLEHHRDGARDHRCSSR